MISFSRPKIRPSPSLSPSSLWNVSVAHYSKGLKLMNTTKDLKAFLVWPNAPTLWDFSDTGLRQFLFFFFFPRIPICLLALCSKSERSIFCISSKTHLDNLLVYGVIAYKHTGFESKHLQQFSIFNFWLILSSCCSLMKCGWVKNWENWSTSRTSTLECTDKVRL